VVARPKFGWGCRFGSNPNLLFIFNFYLCFPNLIIKFSTNPNLTHVKKLVKLFIYLFIYIIIIFFNFHLNGRFSSLYFYFIFIFFHPKLDKKFSSIRDS
jgi:hypothetical protein